MYELVYDNAEISKLCADRFPDAVIEDTSDYVHEERFSFESGTVKPLDFYLFALENAFILSCLEFRLANSTRVEDLDDDWKIIFAELKKVIKAKGE